MNFSWSGDEQRLRDRVREFLARELPPHWDALSRHGPGSREQTQFSLEFCPRLAAAGLLVPHWPAAFGGREGSPWEHLIVGEEMWAAGEPRGPQYMNVNWIGPTLMRFGSDAHQRRHLPAMAAGRALWCQGFSEPSAGSDLAALRTRAELRDGQYVINGSKIWTSYAAMADHCFLLARTAAVGKAGITILLVPMDTPGIVVRPIPSLVGDGDIHEVFFDDVIVPEDCRLGDEGQAWHIIRYSLANERVGIPRYAYSLRVLDRAVARLRAEGRFDEPVVQARAGAARVACEAARMLVYRSVDQRARGQPPSADASLARVAVVQAEQAVADFLLDMLPDEFSTATLPGLLAHHERAIAAGLASGAAEIQLNLIAHDFLRLPREARA